MVAIEAAAARDRRLWPAKAPAACANQTQLNMCVNQTQPAMCANQTQPGTALGLEGLEQGALGSGPQCETDSQSTAEAQDVLQGKLALCAA